MTTCTRHSRSEAPSLAVSRALKSIRTPVAPIRPSARNPDRSARNPSLKKSREEARRSNPRATNEMRKTRRRTRVANLLTLSATSPPSRGLGRHKEVTRSGWHTKRLPKSSIVSIETYWESTQDYIVTCHGITPMVSEPAMQHMKKPKDINTKIAEFVKIVTEVGPDIPLIAKRMGEHKESVRYWFKKLIRQGMVIQASANFEKLGLARVVAVVDFAKEFESQAEPILIGMSQLCYVQSFIKTLPDGHYIVHGAVPVESVSIWMEMMRSLKDDGLFTSLEFTTYDWVRNAPMKSDLYDFDAGRWEFEWSTPAKVYPEGLEGPSPRAQVDKIDLEIMKRLQRDETKPLSEIQRETGINYKTLSFHHRKHVLGRQMLKGHKLNWIGTAYNPQNDRGKHRRHTYQPIDIILRDITPSEKTTVMGLTNALPFLWAEASGKNTYYAQLVFPTETISEAMEFLSRALLPVKDRARWYMADQKHSLSFTLEPRLYDNESRTWRFNQSEVLGKFEQMLLQIKRGP